MSIIEELTHDEIRSVTEVISLDKFKNLIRIPEAVVANSAEFLVGS